MSTALQYPHLTQDADGAVRISGSRCKVIHLAGEHYYQGSNADELLRQHPDLRPEEVYAALTYYYDHREEMIAELEAREAAAAEHAARHPSPVTREELERRRVLKGS
jgi:uncharacterized protein (DUF433 family)